MILDGTVDHVLGQASKFEEDLRLDGSAVSRSFPHLKVTMIQRWSCLGEMYAGELKGFCSLWLHGSEKLIIMDLYTAIKEKRPRS